MKKSKINPVDMRFGSGEKSKRERFFKNMVILGVTVIVNVLVKKGLEKLLRLKKQ